jgi:hypothetical protein
MIKHRQCAVEVKISAIGDRPSRFKPMQSILPGLIPGQTMGRPGLKQYQQSCK